MFFIEKTSDNKTSKEFPYKKTYILKPPCVFYRECLLGSIITDLQQILTLRSLAAKPNNYHGELFHSPKDLTSLSFSDVCFPFDGKFCGFESKTFLSNPNFTFFDKNDVVEYESEDILNFNDMSLETIQKRWNVLVYFYVLVCPFSKRQNALDCYSYAIELIYNTSTFIEANRENFLDTENEIFSRKISMYPKNAEVIAEITNIITQSEKQLLDIEIHTNDGKTSISSNFKSKKTLIRSWV